MIERDQALILETKGKVIKLTDRLRQTAEALEERNHLLEESTPAVGLYGSFLINTGQGLREVVLSDITVGDDGTVAGAFVDKTLCARRA